MRPSQFSDEQIVSAGRALLAQGERVTAFALRKAVGGGNPDRLWQVWEKSGTQLPQVIESVGEVELPMEVEDALNKLLGESSKTLTDLVKHIYSTSNRVSERRVSEMFREAAQIKDNAARDVAEASRQVDELDSELEAVREENEARKLAAEAFAAQDAEKVAELAKLRERLAANAEASKILTEKVQQLEDRAAQAERAADAASHEVAAITGRYEALKEVQAQLAASIAAAKTANRKPAAKRPSKKASAATPPRR